MKRKLTVLAAVVAAVLALAGCSGGATSPDSSAGGTKVAVFSAGYATPAFKFVIDSFQERAKAEGWEVDLYTTDDDFDGLNNYIQTAIPQDYDAFFMTGIDPRPLQVGLAAAKAANIPVFGIDADPEPNDAFTLSVASSQEDLATLSATALIDALGGGSGKKVLLVTFDPSLSISARTVLVQKQLEQAGAEVVDTFRVPNIAASVDATLSYVKDYLQAHPGELDGIWTAWDPAGLGAYQAIAESGQNVQLASVDAMGATVDIIAGGGPFVATVKQDWAAALDELLAGMKEYLAAGSVPSNFIEVPGILVDSSNASTIETNY